MVESSGKQQASGSSTVFCAAEQHLLLVKQAMNRWDSVSLTAQRLNMSLKHLWPEMSEAGLINQLSFLRCRKKKAHRCI